MFLVLFCSNSAHFSEFQLASDLQTDGRTGGHTLFWRCENASKNKETNCKNNENAYTDGNRRNGKNEMAKWMAKKKEKSKRERERRMKIWVKN